MSNTNPFGKKFQMRANGFLVPAIQTRNSEADLDLYIRGYLQALVNRNVLVSYYLIYKKVHEIFALDNI